MYLKYFCYSIITCALLIINVPTKAQLEEPRQAKMEVAVFKPSQQKATEENVSKLELPQGFKIEKFAEGLGNARMLAVLDNGQVYVTAKDEGKVYMLFDSNSDSKADQTSVVSELENVHGITIHDNRLTW